MRPLALSLICVTALSGLSVTPVLAQGGLFQAACSYAEMAPSIIDRRSFADGAVEVAVVNEGAPEMAPLSLVLSGAGLGATPEAQCRYVSWDEFSGFAMLNLSEMAASYDPAMGLVLTTPARFFDQATSFANTIELKLVVDQARQEVSASYQIIGDH